MQVRFLFLFFFLLSLVSKAQYKFSSDPAAFIQDVNTLALNTKQPLAQQTATTFGTTFASYSADQQKKIIELSQKLSKSKKLKAYPDFDNYFALLNACKNRGVSSSNIDTLLYMTDQITDRVEGRQLQNYFVLLRNFTENGVIYRSGYNKLRINAASFNFRYIVPKDPVQLTAPVDTATNTNQNAFSDWDKPLDEQGAVGNIEDTTKVQNIYDVGYNYPIQPQIIGAVLEFNTADFTFTCPTDSTVLKGAKASVMLTTGLVVGNGGTMDWAKNGLNDANCELREYNFPVSSVRIFSEGAKLSYPSQIDDKVEGIFEYRLSRYKSLDELRYPRFKSFNSHVKVKNLDPSIEYEGGFSLSGRKIFSSSVDEGFATIRIKKENKTLVQVESNRFNLGDSLLTSDYVVATLYMEEDSIYHPGATFKYNKSSKIMRLTKQPGYANSPFIDSYHKIEIICDAIIWDLNTRNIDFNITNAKGQVPATFESAEFYESDKYYKLKGIYNFHPLQLVVAYADKNRTNEFYSGDMAKDNKLEPTTVKGAMLYLMKLGYIDFNYRTGLIRLRPKAQHYVKSSRNKKDYDNITFVSLSPGDINATLNLDSNALSVRGVEKIYISDSLRVNFVPNDKKITIQQNRNFKFDGMINTENFQFVGQKFEFNYDSFLVHMPKIDQIRLAVTRKNKARKSTQDTTKLGGKAQILGNELQNSSGTLYINKPDNKSARKKMVQYPIFQTTTGASVYFNKKHINKGAYDTSVRFEIPPFRLDSLSSDDPKTIGFEGTFKTKGIFPDFKEKLIVMPDNSLGFKHVVPKSGYPLYNTKATFYDTLNLDNKGIRGRGEIHYLTTTLWSKDFIFYQDSTLTQGSKVDMKPGKHTDAASDTVTFPDLAVDQYRLRWLPKSDSMFISNVKEPFTIYNKTATMQGTVNVTRNGLLGKGVFFTRGSEALSYKYQFEEKRFSARNAQFKINSDDPEKPAMLGVDVRLNFDLEKNIAYIKPEKEGFASNSFPYVQYRSSLQDGVWDLEKKTVTLKMPEGGNIASSYFYSTRKDQDSLVYNATKGVYDIPSQTLKISGVPYIHVADSKIFPDSGKVFIEQNAVMQTLNKARIQIDTVNKYHNLYNGTIDITSRLKFGGVATYEYVNLGSDTLAIRFQDFRLTEGKHKREGMHTVATGLVKEDDSLYIGPKILYKGKVTMYADNKYLEFDGFMKLALQGALNYSEWLKYTNTGETNQVTIDLNNAMSDNGLPLVTGMHIDKKLGQLYTTFISRKRTQNDFDFFMADKAFEYNLDSNEFRVGKQEKFQGKSYQGNNLRYDDVRSKIYYGGKFNFLDPNDNVKLMASGMGDAKLKDNDYSFNTFLAFNMKFNSKAATVLATDLKKACEGIPGDTTFVDPGAAFKKQEEMCFKLSEIIGNKGIEGYKAKKALGPVQINTLHPDLGKSFTFGNVMMKWSPVFRSFYSVGNIEVTGILKTNIEKAVPGYIEIRKTNRGDLINIYLEPTPNTWYFITYDDNRLAAISSSDDVNKAITGKFKGEPADRTKFFFAPAEPMEKQKFIVLFRENYLGDTSHQQAPEDIPTEEGQEEPKPNNEQPSEIDVTDEVGTEENKTKSNPVAPVYDPNAKKKKKKDPNYDQFKLPGQEQQTEPQENTEKPKPSLEDQKQRYEDQQKLKDLFK